MPKRRDYPEPKPPTISLQEGRRKLSVMREKGVKILENRPLSETSLENVVEYGFGIHRADFW